MRAESNINKFKLKVSQTEILIITIKTIPEIWTNVFLTGGYLLLNS